ncbi:MAG: efflux RND transporter permease subunit [Thermoleophilaceae bacterium]
MVTEHPIATVAVVGALAVIGIALALRLEPSASTDTLVGRNTAAFKATERFRKQFGDESVIIMVRGDLQRTTLTSDLADLIRLEGCLAGNVPPKALAGLPRVCSKIARARPAKVVYGPGTFINTAVAQIQQGFSAKQQEAKAQGEAAAANARKIAASRGMPKAEQDRLAQSAQQLAQKQFVDQSVQLALRYGLTSVPQVNNPEFVSELVFDPSRGIGQPKARFAYLFPSKDAALVQIRLKPGLSDAQRRDAIELYKDAVAQPAFKMSNGQRYVVTGIPVVVDALATSVQHSIFILLGAALLIMAATLAIVFRTRMRLLPLGLALAAAAMTYGFMSLAGVDLTMASIAALPVLIGLAVDYAIQLQARFDEARRERLDPAAAARAAAMRGGPLIAGAALATAAGFLVLLLSPVPMVHGFAVLVIVGIVLALACAGTAGLATLARWSEREPGAPDVPPLLPRVRATAGEAWERIAWSRPGAAIGDAAETAGDWAARRGRAALAFAVQQPRNVLVASLALAALGWAADTQIHVGSDVRKLVPQDMPALRDINTLEKVTGVSGEVDVVLHGNDLTSPAVITWMTSFQQRVLAQHGFQRGETCQQKNPPKICPALSLTDLFRSTPGSEVDARTLLAAVPPYFSQAVISKDRRTANLAFGIHLQGLDTQKQIIDDIRNDLNPPPGVSAEVAGLPVLAAESNDKLSSGWRRALTLLAGLSAVFLVLLAIRRTVEEALVPLIPIAFATGWSALILFVIGIPLNPMSATLGALVIAISTEFSVLLSARYREERELGEGPVDAIDYAYSSTGAAVLASGATAIAGFAALIASNIVMLRQFGIATVVDLTVSLLGVMVVLPAALIWAEERGPFRLRDLDPRPVAADVWGDLREAGRALRRRRSGGRPRAALPRFGGLRQSRRRSRA